MPERDLWIIRTYLGKLLLQICTKMKNKVLYSNLQLVFQTKCKLIIFFTLKDKISVFLCSSIVYKFKCGGCNATYYGKTKFHLKVRMFEHVGVSALAGKSVKGDNDSAVKNIIYFAIIYLVLGIFPC